MIWFGLVWWHINHCRLFNTKSFLYIYIKYTWFVNTFCWKHYKMNLSSYFCTQLNGSKYWYISLTIQLNISHLFTHSWMIKQFYFKQFNSAYIICFHLVWMSNRSILNVKTVLFEPEIGPYQVLRIRVKVDLGATAMKGYTTFLKSPSLTISRTFTGSVGVLPLCKDAVSVFYCPSQLNCLLISNGLSTYL